MPAPEHTTSILLDPALSASQRLEQLLPLVYDQLRGSAQKALASERPGHTLSATALVHEAFVRLVGEREVAWAGRAHFYKAAAEAMRRVLIDHARARGRVKRGGAARRAPLSLADVAESWNLQETTSLDDAFRRLEGDRPGIGEVVRLRFYAGLSVEETAAALEIAPATVKRRWEFGRTWLFRELNREQRHE
ncbi:MAG: ECF-type sigma factor [Planctomycetota bacterium]